MPELYLRQEKANTKTSLYASSIMSPGFESVCFGTKDTDKLALWFYYSQKLAGKLYIGMLTNPKYLFDLNLNERTIEVIEWFICEFYGKRNTTKLNNSHYQLVSEKRKLLDPERTLPTWYSFMLHLKCASYVIRIRKQALICYLEKLNPAYHRCVIAKYQKCQKSWSILKPAPYPMLRMIYSGCKARTCTTCRCQVPPSSVTMFGCLHGVASDKFKSDSEIE